MRFWVSVLCDPSCDFADEFTTMLETNQTPRELGFHMPAEWEHHEATWLSWPHKEESWPDGFETVPGIFVEMTRHLAESELVRINVADVDFAERVNTLLRAGGVNIDAVRFHFNPTNDAWARDHGPIYVVRDLNG